jgi:hypothetical protein
MFACSYMQGPSETSIMIEQTAGLLSLIRLGHKGRKS